MDTLRNPERLEALRRTRLLETPTEASFDRLTRLAATVLNVPTALVSLVDEDRQFFKSGFGLPEPLATERQAPLSRWFCRHAVESGEPLIVSDARVHPLVRDDPAIRDFGVVAYAGIPLRTSDGHVLGTFCVADALPKPWTARDVQVLTDLAASVVTEIELRLEIAARAESERLIRESELKFRQLAENIAEVFWITSPDKRRVEYLSSGYERIWGASREEQYADPTSFLAAIHPDDRDAMAARMEQQAEGPWEVEYRIVRPDGTTRWIRDRGFPVTDERGEIVRIAGLAEDVTAQRAMQEQLRDDARLLGTLERVGRALMSNLAIDSVLQAVVDEITSVTGAEFGAFRFHDRDESGAERTRCTSAGVNAAWVAQLPGRDTADAPAPARSWLSATVASRAGDVLGAIFLGHSEPGRLDERHQRIVSGIAASAATALENARLYSEGQREIEERRRTEAELRESRRALATLLGNLPGMAYRCRNDEHYTLEMVSDGALALTGYTVEELTSSGHDAFDRLIHADDRAMVWAAVQRAVHTDEPFRLTYRIVHRDGGVRWVEEQGRAVQGPDGRVVALEGFITEVTERKRAEEVLRESEERYRAFFEQTPMPMWVYDPGTLRFLAVNESAVSHYGYSREEFLAMAIADIRPAEDVPALLEFVGDIMRNRDGRSKVGRRGAFRHRTKNGAIIHVEISSRELLLDGRMTRLVAVNDITWRIQAEAARAESEAQFRTVVEHAGVGIALVGLDGRPFRTNAALQRMLGRTGEELCAASIRVHTHPDDVERDAGYSAELLAGTRSHYEVSKRYLRKDGSVMWGRLSATLIRDAAGGARFAICMVQDITEARVAEEARAESERKYRQLVELSPEGIVVHQDGRIVFANRATAQLAGADAPPQLLGRSILDFIHPECRDHVRQRLSNLAGGHEVLLDEQRWLRLDGSCRYIEVTSMPFTFRGAPAVQSVFRDVTDRRELEEQLRQSQKMDAVGQLAGGIAHDFNNLLTVIGANTEFLLEELDPADPRHQDAQQIRGATQRATALTRQLLAFSRKQIMTPRPLDLNAVVTSLRPMLTRLIGEDIVIETHLGAGLGQVMADAGQLEQVLVNLVVNARDAMPEGGCIRIESANVSLDQQFAAMQLAGRDRPVVLPGDYVVLTVHDTGVGMTPEVRARAFDPFFTTKPTGKGTGLGLSTVYGIVKQSGGHVWVHSEPGNGTTFRIYLPRMSEAAALSTIDARTTVPPRGSETILLVEDEDAVRELARRTLSRQGYTVLEARNGREALAVATQYEGTIHLVLTDVVMPELSGRGLVERLRAVRPTVAVVYMSGYTDDEIVRRGILASSTAFVQKPFSPSDLLQRIRGVLDGVRTGDATG